MAEAVWAIELDRLPLVVGIDSQGNDIFASAKNRAEKEFARYSGVHIDVHGKCVKE
jgi:fumarate hydratase subunit beta